MTKSAYQTYAEGACQWCVAGKPFAEPEYGHRHKLWKPNRSSARPNPYLHILHCAPTRRMGRATCR